MAFTKSTVEGYQVYTEGLTIPDSAGANPVSVASSTIGGETDGFEVGNRLFPVKLTMKEVSAGDGAAQVKLQASTDGTNWADVDATCLSATLSTLVVNVVGTGIAISTNYEAPYWRFLVFTDGTDTVDAAVVELSFAVKP